MSRRFDKIPAFLVALRAVLAPAVVAGAWLHASRTLLIGLMTAAILSDIFDGVIARRLGVVTERLRVADSRVDLLYYVCIASAVWHTHPEIVRAYRRPLIAIGLFQVFSWVIDLVRYRRIASFHAYLAKVWGLMLFLASVAILGFGHAGPFLWLAIIVGFIGNIEGIAMVLVLPEWQHDVPSIWHALRIRRAQLETSNV